MRVLRYLASARNVVGCLLALGGVALHLAGLLGVVWPFVVAALYAIGALVAPGPREPEALTVQAFDAGLIRRGLDGTLDMARGRVPSDVMTSLAGIRARVLDLLAQADDLPGGAQDLFLLQRTATDYLPATVRMYVALPPAYAATEVVQDGKTPLRVLRDQLELLDEEMSEIAGAVHRRDTDRLLAQGRFLEARFGRGSRDLTLPGPPRPS
jgi:hypothetical protein